MKRVVVVFCAFSQATALLSMNTNTANTESINETKEATILSDDQKHSKLLISFSNTKGFRRSTSLRELANVTFSDNNGKRLCSDACLSKSIFHASTSAIMAIWSDVLEKVKAMPEATKDEIQKKRDKLSESSFFIYFRGLEPQK